MLRSYLIILVLLAAAAVVTTADVFDQMDEFWHTMDQQFEKLDNEMDKIFENSDWDKPPFQATMQSNVYQVIMRLDGISENEVKVNTYGNVVVINAMHDEPNMRRQFHHTQVIPPGYKTIGRWKFNSHKHVLTLMFDKVRSTTDSSTTGAYHNTRYAGANRNRYQPPNGNQNTNLPGQFHSTDNGHGSPAGSVETQDKIHQTEQEQTEAGTSTIPYGRVPIAQGSTYRGSNSQGLGNTQNNPLSWQSTGHSDGQGEQVGSGQATSTNNDSPTGDQNSNIGSERPPGGQDTSTGSGYASRGLGSNYRTRQQSGGQTSNNGVGYQSVGQGSNYGAVYPAAGGLGSNNGAGHSSARQGSNHGSGYTAGGQGTDYGSGYSASGRGSGYSSAGQGLNHGAIYPAGGQGSYNGAGHSSAGHGTNYGAGHPAGGQSSNYGSGYQAGGYGSNNGAGHSSAEQGSNYGVGYPVGQQGSNNGAGTLSIGPGPKPGAMNPAGGYGSSNNDARHSSGGRASNNGAGYSSAGQGLNYGTRQPSGNVNGVTEQPGEQGENVTPDIFRSSSHQRRAGGGFVDGDHNTFRQWETARSNSQAHYHIDSDGQVIPLGEDETLPDAIKVNESRQQFHSVSETHTVDRTPESTSTGHAGSNIGNGDNPPQQGSSGRLRNGKIYTSDSNTHNQKY